MPLDYLSISHKSTNWFYMVVPNNDLRLIRRRVYKFRYWIELFRCRDLPALCRAHPQRDSDSGARRTSGLRGRQPASFQGKGAVGVMNCFRTDYWISWTPRDHGFKSSFFVSRPAYDLAKVCGPMLPPRSEKGIDFMHRLINNNINVQPADI